MKAWCSRWVGIAQRMCSEPPGRSSGCSSRPEFCSLGLRLGNWGCAFLQIEVGRSSWPLDRPYLTLVPSVALMTPADSKLDRNRCGVRMFKEGKGKPIRSTRPSGEVVWGCPIALCPPPPPPNDPTADFLVLAAGQKWDRLRLTCSQPFRHRGQFGLCFIRVRTPLDPELCQPAVVG